MAEALIPINNAKKEEMRVCWPKLPNLNQKIVGKVVNKMLQMKSLDEKPPNPVKKLQKKIKDYQPTAK